MRNIGPNVILLSPDTRSERTIHQVLPPQAWDTLFREVERRLAASRGAVQHLVVLLPVPIVYPKIPVTETALAAISSRCWRVWCRAVARCRRCQQHDVVLSPIALQLYVCAVHSQRRL